MDKYFTNIALQSTHRVLNLLDRNSYSRTFGCFDKYYWHFKTKDFPSSSYQMGVEFLARLWNFSDKDNLFYKNSQLLEWIKAGLKYTCSIQHKDGSFDEWYPNERGWAGPASYVIHSLFNAYKITESRLEEGLKRNILNCFLKTSRFLRQQKEGAHLANHYALFLLSLYEISQIIPDTVSKTDFEDYLMQFKSFVSKEGWSMEYDGVDFGYNLATLSFLARLHKIVPHPFLEEYAKKNFHFLSYFFYPDGSFGGLGSRETIHLYPYALKYWSQFIPLAGSIDHYLRKKNSYAQLNPLDQDDHYLFYRLSEYLEADEITNSLPESRASELPCLSKKSFKTYFSESGLFIWKSDDFYLTANMKKGAGLRVYNVKTGKCLLKNNGWLAQLKNKTTITNCYISQEHKVAVMEDEIRVSGAGMILKQKDFHPATFIVFRVILLMIRNYKLAFWFKKLVRKVLILAKRKSKYKFERIITFKKGIFIKDIIHCPPAEKLFYGGAFTVRYVPQSNYFEMSDLQNPSHIFNLKKGKRQIIIKQFCNLEKTETCLSDI